MIIQVDNTLWNCVAVQTVALPHEEMFHPKVYKP